MEESSSVVTEKHVLQLMVVDHPEAAIATMVDLMERLVKANALIERQGKR